MKLRITLKQFYNIVIGLLSSALFCMAEYTLWKGMIEQCTKLNIGAISFFIFCSILCFAGLIFVYSNVGLIKFKDVT